MALALAGALPAQERTVDFDRDDALADWQVSGEVALDATTARAGRALRVGPGGRAVLKLREADGAGEVRFWVFDDGTAPADPKAGRATAHWGVVNAEGRVLAVGPFCAAYLTGDTSYSTGEYDPAKREQPYHKVAFLGVNREARWREWTFRFDPEKGLAILVDGRDVNAQRKRYDWDTSGVGGFASIVVAGDEAGGRAQTIRVDDISITLGGPMIAKPVPPPPPPPIVPVTDEPLAGATARLRPEVAGVHPRLLFGPEDLPRLRANYNHPSMAAYRKGLEDYLGASRRVPEQPGFLGDATDGQRQGLWRMPTVAYHYQMTGDAASGDAAVGYLKMLAGLNHWENPPERDSGMSSANVLIGAALAFDWVNDRLDPEFREQFRRKLILMARRQYYGGHLRRNAGVHYWQGDPQNNHRWHRNAGMVLAAIAGYAGPEDDWILTKARDDVRYVMDWLPDDGTSHESQTYLLFGGTHLTLAVEALDRCLGEKLLEREFFRHVGPFYAQTITPGLDTYFYYGDAGGAPGKGYFPFLYRAAALHRQADLQAMLDALTGAQVEVNIAWAVLLWRDPSLAGGRVDALPRRALFPDLGMVMVREGWEKQHVGMMFRCGPLGGYKLNEFRNENNFAYVNIAHDDPDANMFILYKDGRLIAETDRYSMVKQSIALNTIMVNGRGQSAAGRSDVDGWTQPGTGPSDMTQGIRLTAYKAENGIVIAEGEAGGAYHPQQARGGRAASPGLTRFRRAAIWVEGRYVLILDDVRPRQPSDISWLVQAQRLERLDGPDGAFRLAHDGGGANLHLASDLPLESEIVDSPAANRQTPLGWRQLRAHARRVPAVRFAGVLTPWGGDAQVTITANGPESWTFEVKTAAGVDRWTWTAVPYPDAPYGLEGRLADGTTVRVTADDKAPIE